MTLACGDITDGRHELGRALTRIDALRVTDKL